MNRFFRLFLAALLLSSGLAACGKRGHLEPPGGEEKARQEEKSAANAGGKAQVGTKTTDDAEDGMPKLSKMTANPLQPSLPPIERTQNGDRKDKERVGIKIPKRDLPIDALLE